MDGQPLSAADLRRLKLRRSQAGSTTQAAARTVYPRGDWRETVRGARLALRREIELWSSLVPRLMRGEFVFTIALWAAVFSVAAGIVALPGIPLKVRYAAGLAAVAYLYLYAELSRLRAPLRLRRLLLTLADAGVVACLGWLSAPYTGYAHVLVFFAAARIAVRFSSPLVLPIGPALLLPFDLHLTAGIAPVLDVFGVLTLMLVLQQLQAAALSARAQVDRQAAMVGVTSALARCRDEDTLSAQLISLAPALIPGSAWVFWVKEAASDDFRAARWSGLGSVERPVVNFTPSLAPDSREAVTITGPLPGTATGELTLLQPVVVDGQPAALLTIGAGRDTFDTANRALLRTLAEEIAVTLARVQAIDEQRNRRLAMEQANRVAAVAAGKAGDHAAALDALMPELAAVLRVNSVHIEWVDGDQLEIVAGSADPLTGYAPSRLALAGTRTADALLEGRTLREPVTGRRPDDLFCVPAGLRQAAVVPMRCAGVDGTLQVGRRDSRAFSAGETMLLELLAERLSLLFAAGINSTPNPTIQEVAA